MDSHALINLIFSGLYGIVLWPLGAGLRHWSRLDTGGRLLWVWLLTMLVLTGIVGWDQHQHRQHRFMNYPETLAVLGLVGGFYARLLGGWLLPVLIGGLSVGVVVEGWPDFNHLNISTMALSRLLVLGCACRALWQLVEQTDGSSLRRNPYLYYHIGFVLFGGLTAGSYWFKTYLSETSPDLFYGFDAAETLLDGVTFGLIAIGFQTAGRHRLATRLADHCPNSVV
jgi:hypothetical protein